MHCQSDLVFIMIADVGRMQVLSHAGHQPHIHPVHMQAMFKGSSSVYLFRRHMSLITRVDPLSPNWLSRRCQKWARKRAQFWRGNRPHRDEGSLSVCGRGFGGRKEAVKRWPFFGPLHFLPARAWLAGRPLSTCTSGECFEETRSHVQCFHKPTFEAKRSLLLEQEEILTVSQNPTQFRHTVIGGITQCGVTLKIRTTCTILRWLGATLKYEEDT